MTRRRTDLAPEPVSLAVARVALWAASVVVALSVLLPLLFLLTA